MKAIVILVLICAVYAQVGVPELDFPILNAINDVISKLDEKFANENRTFTILKINQGNTLCINSII